MSVTTETRRLKKNSFRRSACPIACALDVIGDKWSLLIIRDLLMGKRRYKQFLAASEGITTNILADRLQKLEAAGLLYKTPYQDNPLRYEYHLTATGRSLKPVIWSIVDWANSRIPGTYKPQRLRGRQQVLPSA